MSLQNIELLRLTSVNYKQNVFERLRQENYRFTTST